MMSGRLEWEALPAELLELVMRRLLSPEFCTFSSMKAALALAGCCKGTKGLFDHTRQRLRHERPGHMNGDVFFELDVVGWTSARGSMFFERHNNREPADECPYKVGFRLRWSAGSWCHGPGAKFPIDFHVLVALKAGPWDGANSPPHHLVVDRSVTSLGERGYVIGGRHFSAKPGQIVINQHETELPTLSRSLRLYVKQVVVKSDPLLAFFAS